jgi:GntR family transcriptional regulator
MIMFRLSKHSGVPTYLQIVQQVKQALQLGTLETGDRLPTVKEVLSMITINPNTVLKAYGELESEGIVEGRPGRGTFVVRRPAGPSPQTQAVLAESLRKWVSDAKSSKLNDESIEALLRAVLHNEGGA